MTRLLTLDSVTENILIKMTARRRIGWTDFSRGSWDHRCAERRAEKILQRIWRTKK